MQRLCVCLLFLVSARCASDDPTEILNRIRANVAAQLEKSANYTCVQTIDRTYFASTRDLSLRCAEPPAWQRKEMIHDRLRLDIAVSEGQEIYSWHGENRFSSSTIASVVGNGPVSSGNFIGFLHNIFLLAGIQFTYAGTSDVEGVTTVRFHFVVPLARSGYHVKGPHALIVVPFHGSFTANAADYQLISLQVTADALPGDSNICSAETDVKYQIINISGTPALIPVMFLLRVDDDSNVYTTSRSHYSECREFRGESTLRFDLSDTSKPFTTTEPSVVDEWLPAGLTLHVGLRAPIDSRTAYTGDAVEGVLLDRLQVPGTKTVIPQGAILHGVITLLEHRSEPWKHSLVSIEFQRLTYGKNSFLLRATPKTPKKSSQELTDLYGSSWPPFITAYSEKGVFVLGSSHVHLDTRFSAQWATTKRPEETPTIEGQ